MGCRIVICDDYDAYRFVVNSVLADDERFDVVGEATNGREAIDLCAQLKPDVVLLDIAMPVMDGMAALPEIRRACPGTRVVMHTAFAERSVASDAMELGASAYLEKGADLDVIVETILEACGDGAAVSP